MMSTRLLMVVAIAVTLMASQGSAEPIIIQYLTVDFNTLVGTGVNADYDAGTGVLTWSQGASGYLMDTDGYVYADSDIDVVAHFSNVVDYSSGGVGLATFALDSVQITFNSIEFSLTGAPSQAIFTLSPYGAYRYWESEIDPDLLHGQALVGVNAVFYLEPVWGSTHECIWDNGNNVSLLDAMVLLPNGANFQGYQGSYSSDNNTIVLLADESGYQPIPEPCTLGLVGLGLILIRKRLA